LPRTDLPVALLAQLVPPHAKPLLSLQLQHPQDLHRQQEAVIRQFL
jgi:hypothetical protein